jgi:hypothetical protein
VTCPLKARTVESEETAVARQWLLKQASTATKSRDCSNGYTRNNRRTVGSGIFYAVRAKPIYWGPNHIYWGPNQYVLVKIKEVCMAVVKLMTVQLIKLPL